MVNDSAERFNNAVMSTRNLQSVRDTRSVAATGRSDRKMEHIEIIDTACKQLLGDRRAKFAPTHHDRIMEKFEDSRLAGWPRRSCEAIFYPMTEGKPCEKFPFPSSKDLDALQTAAARIEEFEVESR